MSSIQSPASRVQCPGSSIQSPGFRVQHPEYSIQSPVSRVQRLTLVSRVQKFRYAIHWKEITCCIYTICCSNLSFVFHSFDRYIPYPAKLKRMRNIRWISCSVTMDAIFHLNVIFSSASS